MLEYFTGDTRPIAVDVTTDGSAAAIDTAATVRVGFVSLQGRKIAGPWVATAQASGANWAVGRVVVQPDANSTAALPAQMVRVEIEISKSGVIETRQSRDLIHLKKGGLP